MGGEKIGGGSGVPIGRFRIKVPQNCYGRRSGSNKCCRASEVLTGIHKLNSPNCWEFPNGDSMLDVRRGL